MSAQPCNTFVQCTVFITVAFIGLLSCFAYNLHTSLWHRPLHKSQPRYQAASWRHSLHPWSDTPSIASSLKRSTGRSFTPPPGIQANGAKANILDSTIKMSSNSSWVHLWGTLLLTAPVAMAVAWARMKDLSKSEEEAHWMLMTSGVESEASTTSPLVQIEGPLSDVYAFEFLRDGHIFVPQLFNPEMLTKDIGPAICKWYDNNRLQALQHAIKINAGRKDADTLSLEQCEAELTATSKEDIPFLQSFNIWQTCPEARRLALSPNLGRIAATLLGVPAVRLYQDSLFFKRPGDGPTEWHSDLNMAPFDTNDMVSCWIPLQPVPCTAEGGTGLIFATASHRDFALPFWSDPRDTDTTERYNFAEAEPMEVGDCTFHHGWTLHCAPGNELSEPRYAYTVSYIADGAPLLQKEGHIRYPDLEDYQSYKNWIDDVGWGGIAQHELLPLVYSEEWDDDFEP